MKILQKNSPGKQVQNNGPIGGRVFLLVADVVILTILHMGCWYNFFSFKSKIKIKNRTLFSNFLLIMSFDFLLLAQVFLAVACYQ